MVMDDALDIKLANQIKQYLVKSCKFLSRDGKIVDVKDISVTFNNGFAKNMQDQLPFDGTAEFWFEAPNGVLSHRLSFQGTAQMCGCDVMDVEPKTIYVTK